MDLDLYNSELCLAHNAPIRLLSARGVRVICTAGLLWLTVEGEAGVMLLSPEMSHLIRGSGLALLEAIGSGRVRFEKAAHPLRMLLSGRLRWSRQRAGGMGSEASSAGRGIVMTGSC